MHDNTPRSGWRQWRITLADGLASNPLADRFQRSSFPTHSPQHSTEVAGPDGIRRELVARIKQQIEAGTYDTEERWLAAEALILERYESAA